MQNNRTEHRLADNVILKLEHVSHHFLPRSDEHGEKKAAAAVHDVSFEAKRGSFVSLMGPSGCGKSTLLRLIAGTEKLQKGSIDRGYRELAMVFQSHAIFPWLTVRENAAFGLDMKGMPKSEQRKIVDEKLEEVGLIGPGVDLGDAYPNQLSGGQKQRVSVARALAVSPEILLMDEPFSSLDSITAERLKTDIFRLFKKYNMTVVMVNHLIEDAIELSDEVIVLSKAPGSIKEQIRIDLPFPRDQRSTHFFTLVDRIRNLIEE